LEDLIAFKPPRDKAMENDSSLNATINESALVLVPIGAVAFAPFLLLELVAAVVSNAILLALVILACVKKLNNNINIYLFSLAVGGLIGAIDIFCLLSLVVARRWVLGRFMCNVSYFVEYFIYVFFTAIYVVISRDKLKAVKDPLHGRPTNKRAYINSIILWVISLGAAVLFLALGVRVINGIPDLFHNRGNFICFGLTSRRTNRTRSFVYVSVFIIGYWIVSSIVILATFSNFVRILIELRTLKKIRQRHVKCNDSENCTNTTIKINGRDKPLYRTGEERTAKSLSLIYFIQLGCILISSGMLYVQISRNFILPPENSDGPDFQIYFIVLLSVQLYACVNPIFLILSNKRLRTRVKELFKCTLSPEVEASPVHKPTNKQTTAVRYFAPKTNKIMPLTEHAYGNEKESKMDTA
jgi:hypothetical protein